jgi:hypothetical protein
MSTIKATKSKDNPIQSKLETSRMNNLTTILFILALATMAATTPAQSGSGKTCQKVLLDGGASSKFDEHAGHAIHSLTVEDLKRFEPTVTANNKVPTVNR